MNLEKEEKTSIRNEKLLKDLEYVENRLLEKTKPGYVATRSERTHMAIFEILFDILTHIIKKEKQYGK